MVKKVPLIGGPDKSATWIWMDPASGQFKVEYYDFSEPAQRFFGNDIAWTITVNDMDSLYSSLNQNEETLIPWMEHYFKSYFGIKQWLEDREIDFSIERESWA
jgi:hypothetical protein